MKTRNTLIITVVAILVAGAVYALGRLSAGEVEGTATPQTKPTHMMNTGTQMDGATHPGN